MKKGSDAPVGTDLNFVKMDNVPVGFDSELRERIKLFAEEHNFIISEFVEHKIKWSEEHQGRCPCDPYQNERKKCPCNHVYEDMADFNGQCVCGMFWKQDAYERWKYQWLRRKDKKTTVSDEYTMTDEEYKEAKNKIKKVWKDLS